MSEPAMAADEPLEFIDGLPRLAAGRCAHCDDYSFPLRTLCQKCGSPIARIHLPTRGVLWTWTSQEFEPPSPPYSPDSDEPFTPFTVGYVEFPGFLRVEGRLTESDPTVLSIGMEMTLTAVPRNRKLTYAFAPASSVNGTDS